MNIYWLYFFLLLESAVNPCFGKDFRRTFTLKRSRKLKNETSEVEESSGWNHRKLLEKARNIPEIPTLPPIPTLSPRKMIINKFSESYDSCKAVNLCSNGGTCVNDAREYYCNCKPEYYGKTCQFFADPRYCYDHQCQNGGTCYSLPERQKMTNPKLLNNDFDIRKDNLTVELQYMCWCKRGFYGTFCEFSEAMRHCAEETCSGHGIINRASLEQKEDFVCQCLCENHYSGNHCERVSPCRDLDCTNNGKCVEDTEGRAKCECPQKSNIMFIEADIKGENCEDIHIDDTHVTAESCIPCSGKFVDWIECLHKEHDIDSSKLERLWKPCEKDAEDCYEQLKEKECLNNGTCFVALDNYTLLDETIIDKSFLVPKCLCPGGYEGEFCQRQIPNVFEEYNCINGVPSKDNVTLCICDPGYKGASCEIKDPCHNNTCGEGSLCVEILDGTNEPRHACICNLSQDIDASSLSCKTPHHAACMGPDGMPRCRNDGHCYPCALDDNDSNLCSVDEKKRGFRCICPPGLLLPFCDNTVSACDYNQCQNDAKCVTKDDTFADYRCECKKGYNGTFCEQVTDICLVESKCVNGKCVKNSKSARGYSCRCDEGYQGFNCQLKNETTFWDYIDNNFWFVYPLLAALLLIPFAAVVLWLKNRKSKKEMKTDPENSNLSNVSSVGTKIDGDGASSVAKTDIKDLNSNSKGPPAENLQSGENASPTLQPTPMKPEAPLQASGKRRLRIK